LRTGLPSLDKLVGARDEMAYSTSNPTAEAVLGHAADAGLAESAP